MTKITFSKDVQEALEEPWEYPKFIEVRIPIAHETDQGYNGPNGFEYPETRYWLDFENLEYIDGSADLGSEDCFIDYIYDHEGDDETQKRILHAFRTDNEPLTP